MPVAVAPLLVKPGPADKCGAQMAAGKQHTINRPGLSALIRGFSPAQMRAAVKHLRSVTGLTREQLPGCKPILFFVTMPESYDDGYKALQKYVEGKVSIHHLTIWQLGSASNNLTRQAETAQLFIWLCLCLPMAQRQYDGVHLVYCRRLCGKASLPTRLCSRYRTSSWNRCQPSSRPPSLSRSPSSCGSSRRWRSRMKMKRPCQNTWRRQTWMRILRMPIDLALAWCKIGRQLQA